MDKKDKEKHKYLVGFAGENQSVYGKDVKDERFSEPVASCTQPMTVRQALRQLNTLSGKYKRIYEIRPISITKARILSEMVKKE